jgi:TatD DNase family protein
VGGVDSHLHLDFFERHEVAPALTRARAAGIDATITVGMDLARSRCGVELADAHDGVFAAVGIHPWCAEAYADAVPLDELAALARHPRVVAIGEVGLDFVDNLATGASYAGREARAVQEACLRAQIGLAAELDLPLIVHSRGAHAAVLRLLDEVPCRAAIQFFEGDAAAVRRYVERGHAISLGSRTTLDAGAEWRAAVSAVPDDRLLLETDAPWSPAAGTGRERSEPGDLPVIANAVANARGSRPADLLATAAATAARFFRL